MYCARRRVVTLLVILPIGCTSTLRTVCSSLYGNIHILIRFIIPLPCRTCKAHRVRSASSRTSSSLPTPCGNAALRRRGRRRRRRKRRRRRLWQLRRLLRRLRRRGVLEMARACAAGRPSGQSRRRSCRRIFRPLVIRALELQIEGATTCRSHHWKHQAQHAA